MKCTSPAKASVRSTGVGDGEAEAGAAVAGADDGAGAEGAAVAVQPAMSSNGAANIMRLTESRYRVTAPLGERRATMR
ncbi:hypothetical protein GCM10009827_037770 [Dactylosporangium maewongense]|uniref:Uncharacterized protein n=1 Tax=Dactylosporangium maewongense TaxID=634393 RepID=A0ABN2AJE7_9ACTN